MREPGKTAVSNFSTISAERAFPLSLILSGQEGLQKSPMTAGRPILARKMSRYQNHGARSQRKLRYRSISTAILQTVPIPNGVDVKVQFGSSSIGSCGRLPIGASEMGILWIVTPGKLFTAI